MVFDNENTKAERRSSIKSIKGSKEDEPKVDDHVEMKQLGKKKKRKLSDGEIVQVKNFIALKILL